MYQKRQYQAPWLICNEFSEQEVLSASGTKGDGDAQWMTDWDDGYTGFKGGTL